jgi:ATP-binding cassette subfamily B protein
MSAGSLSESGLFIEDLARLILPTEGRPAPRPITAVDEAPAEPVPIESWSIAAEHVTFTYSGADRPALEDVSIVIHPGEVVALVGPNGSGKTTLAKLLAGLYLPDAGRVRLNSVDTSNCDREQAGRSIAVVFQDFMRYALTAYDNIALGRTERFAEAPAVEEAARQAGIDHAIRQLPHGYESVLAPQFEDGVDLSLGQWQRVALARAYLRGASFVILDEPTAALDARAEEELFDRIRELMAGQSVLLISHRFSTVRLADRIYVLEGGSIIEAGAHDDLVADDGLYAELFRAQAAAYG